MENRFSEVPATRTISVPELSRRTRHQLHLARRDDKLSRRFKLEYMEGGAVSSREHSAYSERIAYEAPQTISHRNLTATVAVPQSVPLFLPPLDTGRRKAASPRDAGPKSPSSQVTTTHLRSESISQEARQPRLKRSRKPRAPKTAPLTADELDAVNDECELALAPARVREEEAAPSWAKLEHGADDPDCLLKCKQYFDMVRSVTHSKPRQFNLS